MALKQEMLHGSYPPHVNSGESVVKVMWSVAVALAPACAYSVYLFGMRSLAVIAVSAASAVIAEALIQLLLKRPVAARDGSAVVTGLLLAMNLPPHVPLWMVVIGAFFAVIMVKQLFGGLGFNIFNPALAGRAFLMASWPVHMTTAWHQFTGHTILSPGIKNTLGFSPPVFDALTQATPLALLKEGPKILVDNNMSVARLYDMAGSPEMLKSLFIGNVGGCIGETSALLLLAGGLVLIFRRLITWHIPVSFIGTVAFFTAIYYFIEGVPAFHLMALYHCLSGGLFLGAIFMATDPVTSPVSARGMLAFGTGCGLVTCVIRFWGGYPEGVSYAILIMNAFVPLIDRFTKPRVFGVGRVKRRSEARQ